MVVEAPTNFFRPTFREYLDHCPRPDMELLTDILKDRGNRAGAA